MAIRTFNSVGGFSVGETPVNVILANGDITTANITATGSVAAGNIKTDNLLHANGVAWDFQLPAGSNTYVQFNNEGDFGASANFTFNSATNVLTVTGNVVATGVKTNNLYYANGTAWDFQLPAGSSKYIQYNDNGSFGATANFQFDSATNTLTLTNGAANLSNVNVSGAVAVTGNVTANNVTANSQLISGVATGTAPIKVDSTTRVANLNVSYANVADYSVVTTRTTGTYYLTFANGSTTANYALGSNTALSFDAATGTLSASKLTGTLTTTAQPNITSVGTLTSLTVGNATANTTFGNGTITASGTITGGNISTGGTVSATGNVSGGNITTGGVVAATGNVSGGNITTTGVVSTPNIVSGNTFIALAANGNITIGVSGDSNVIKISDTLTTIDGNLTVSGTISGNVNANVTAPGSNTQIIFNDGGVLGANASLTFDKASNVLTVTGSASVSKDLTVTGNLTVSGTTAYVNVTNTSIVDPLIDLGGTANGGNLAASDGKDRGLILHNYYNDEVQNQAFVWKTSASQFQLFSTATASNEIVTGTLGNLKLETLVGNVDTGSSGKVTTPTVENGTSNIKIVSSGNIALSSAGTANVLVITTTGANVTGTVVASGNVSGANLTTTGVVAANTGNITTSLFVGNATSNTSISAGNVTTTGNVSANNAVISKNLGIGDTNINWATKTTTSTDADQEIANISATGVRGVEFFVKGEEAAGGKYYIATVSAVHNGATVDYAVYGTVDIVGSTGTLGVTYGSGRIKLVTKPASANSTVWVTQYRTI